MKHKRKTVCNNCRRRKLGCDGKQPGCSQCSLSGYTCDGYSKDWTFIQQSTSYQHEKIPLNQNQNQYQIYQQTSPQIKLRNGSPDSLELAQKSSPIQFPLCSEISTPPSLNHLLNVIVENYLPESERNASSSSSGLIAAQKHPRICGTWVEVLYELPCLTNDNSVLSKAVTALAAAVLGLVAGSSQSFSEPYLLAIRSLREELENGVGAIHELIPAVMCLVLVEVMIPNATAALDAHLNAAGAFFRACGPAACKNGLLHRLFVGFRPLMIIHAIQHRSPTFLSNPSWIEIPFSESNPSIMQAFLSDFVDVPGLFHQVDCLNISLSADSPPINCPEMEGQLSHLADISTRLDRWEHSLELPQYSHKHADDRPILYPSVTMANIFTHLWAFKVIVIQEMAILKAAYSENASSPSSQPRDQTNDRATTISLAKKITLSMEYLLKEEMGLFGPASSSFPLLVAWDVLKDSGDDYYQDYIERIVQRLIDRGLLSAPTLVFGSDLG